MSEGEKIINFFITGFPKSGTTWLQQIINAHPDAGCRPEDNFYQLFQELGSVLHSYNELRETMNHRTGQVGEISKYGSEDLAFMLIQAVRAALVKSNKEISGTKDNSILQHLDLFQAAFSEYKIIHIVRDPRDCAVSSWYHNSRVEGKQEFLDRAGVSNIDEWAVKVAKMWQNDTAVDLFTVKYEDFLENFNWTAARVLKELGLNTDKQILQDIQKITKFKKSGNKFYRKGKSGTHIEELKPETITEMSRIAHTGMARYGYVST